MSLSSSLRLLPVLAACAAVTLSKPAGAVVEVTGSFRTEVNRLKSVAFGSGSNLYVPPTTAQRTSFRTLLNEVWTGNFLATGSTASIDAQAAALNYEFVRFNDTDTGQTYYQLREVLVGGKQQTGWGTYAVNFNATANTLVEAPHILFDTNTEDLSARAFQSSAARGFLLAGANRNANGEGTADVAHLNQSIFFEAHKSWNGPTAATTGYQIHGFADRPDWPTGITNVLADGSRSVTGRMIDLDTRLDATPGFASYAHNNYDVNDPRNVQVNGTVPGSIFTSLAGTTNDQGAYSRGLGGTFVHAEFAWNVRGVESMRIAAAALIADTMRQMDGISTVVVKRWDGGVNGTSNSWTVNGASSWALDGLPVATHSVRFDNVLTPTLPATMTLSAQNLTVRNIVWDSTDSSLLRSATTGSGNSVIRLLGSGPISAMPLLQMTANAGNATFTFSNTNGSTGSGAVQLMLCASGAFDVVSPDATLVVDSPVTEDVFGRRLTKSGAGRLILNNAGNNFTGGLTLAGGVLETADMSTVGEVPAVVDPDNFLFQGGTLRFTGATASTHTRRGVTLAGAGGTLDVAAGTMTIGGVIAGGGPLTKIGNGSLTLSGVNTFSGGITVNAGSLRFNNDSRLGHVGNTLTLGPAGTLVPLANIDAARKIIASGGAIDTGAFTFGIDTIDGTDIAKRGAGTLLTNRVRLDGALAIDAGIVRMRPSGAPAMTNVVGSLALAGGATPTATLDLADNAIVIDYAGPSPLSTHLAQIKHAYAGGAWTGAGIKSGLVAANTAVGIAEASEVVGPDGGAWRGVEVDGDAVLIRLTRVGDTNLDGAVDFNDLLKLAQHYGVGSGAPWSVGDGNYDGAVDFADLLALAQNYGGGPSLEGLVSADFAADWALAQSLIPEPAMFASLAVLSILTRRRA